MIQTYPLCIDTTATDTAVNATVEYNSPKLIIETHSGHYNIIAPQDNYTLMLYDMSGKLLFNDRFYGETAMY